MTLPAYKPPAINTARAKVYSIPVVIDTPAPGIGCVVTDPIPFPFRIIRIVYGCLEAVPTIANYYFFVSDNANTPLNAPPPDDNILAALSPQAFVRCPAGNAVLQWNSTGPTLEMNYEVSEPNKRLKVYVQRVLGAGGRHQAIFTIEKTD